MKRDVGPGGGFYRGELLYAAGYRRRTGNEDEHASGYCPWLALVCLPEL